MEKEESVTVFVWSGILFNDKNVEFDWQTLLKTVRTNFIEYVREYEKVYHLRLYHYHRQMTGVLTPDIYVAHCLIIHRWYLTTYTKHCKMQQTFVIHTNFFLQVTVVYYSHNDFFTAHVEGRVGCVYIKYILIFFHNNLLTFLTPLGAVAKQYVDIKIKFIAFG